VSLLEVGERIIILREAAGYKKRTEFAKAIGINPSTLANYETRRHEINHEWLVKFADFFNVSVDYILGRTKHKHNIIEHNALFVEVEGESVTAGEFYDTLNELSPEHRKVIVDMANVINSK